MKKHQYDSSGLVFVVVALTIIIAALLMVLSSIYHRRGIPEKMEAATQQLKAELPKLDAEIVEIAE